LFLIGIDLGTSGIRGIIIDSTGKIILNLEKTIPLDILYKNCNENKRGWHEQNPFSWKEYLYKLIADMVNYMNNSGYSVHEIVGICTDSTSGTLLSVNKSGTPITNAIMYNDNRSIDETPLIQKYSEELSQKIGINFKASFSLPKIFWIKRNRPDIFQRAYKFLHANDFLIGLLSDEFYHSDTSNCLKAGYDYINKKWPDFIETELGIAIGKLPEVVDSGHIITKTSKELEKKISLPSEIPIIAGATDSIMALIASGACNYGDIFTSLGSTLVTRVLTQNLIKDPLGRVYCHILPGRKKIYLPGGASSVGATCLQYYFPDIDYEFFDKKSIHYFPTKVLTYPLVKKGERFPFIDHNAEHFSLNQPLNEYDRYCSYLQGVAFVERLCIEILENLGAKTCNKVFTIGGGTKSLEWSQIRADILQRNIYIPKVTGAAYGCCILAVSSILFDQDLLKTIRKFVKLNTIIKPRKELKDQVEKYYNRFIIEIKKRFHV